MKRRINKQKSGGRRRLESGALQDFPILRSARDYVYLRFAEVLRRRKLHVPKTDWMYPGEQRRELWIKKKKEEVAEKRRRRRRRGG